MTAAIHTHTCSGCGAGLTCACEDRRDFDRITGRHRNLRCLKCCDAIVMALDLGIELTESMLAHVSHGGPSRADGKRWLDQAKAALNPAPIRCDNPACDWSGTIPENGRCPKCNGQGFLLPAVKPAPANYGPPANIASCDALRSALREAIGAIEIFHGPGWELYRDHSPEMKRWKALLG